MVATVCRRAGADAALIEWGVAERRLPGQDQSGDHYVVATHERSALLAVIDGLGHGAAAAVASKTAAAVFEQHSNEDVIGLIKRSHEALRQTRGAAILLAAYDEGDSSVACVGVGNVEGLVLRHDFKGTRKQRVLMRGGVVGYKLPPLRQVRIGVERGDLLVAATDGVRSSFTEHLPLLGTPSQIAHEILAGFAKENDDALVLVARFDGQT